MQTTDILVVGAGAAGASLGYLLKQAGRDVLMLEMLDARKKNKLCAGILEHRAEEAFYSIFGRTVEEAGLAVMAMEKVIVRSDSNEMSKVMPRKDTAVNVAAETAVTPATEDKGLGGTLGSYFKNGGKMAAKMLLKKAIGYEPGRVSFRALPRKYFDDYILAQYLTAGGKLLDRTTVRSIDEEKQIALCVNLATKETFEVKYNTLVGADGANSIVRRLLTGKRQKTFLALEAKVPFITRDNLIYLSPEERGYFWYIPRGEDATVGCCYHKLGCENEKIRANFDACCADMGLEIDRENLRGALIPEGDDVLLKAGKNGYLLGEAAGLSDNFSGGGIHYALWSAKALADALTGGPAYEKAMKPHVEAVKKNSGNSKLYFTAAGKVVELMGTKKNN